MEENHVNGHEHHENGFQETSDPPNFEIPKAKLEEVKVTDFMTECLDKVATSEGFRNYETKIDHGSAVGDGFIGILLKVTIFENQSDKKLALVLKSPPLNPVRRNAFGAMAVFKREITMYNEILPEFVKFQEEKKISTSSGFFNFPKCYYAEYNEEKDDALLIMEDLKENGYKMWDKFTPINFEHSKLLMQSLGRFHAISFALKDQRPEVFEKFKTLDDFMSKTAMDENFIKMMVQNLERAVSTLDESDIKRRNKILKLTENIGQILKDSSNPEFAEPYAIVTHGDCWSNNFMYQYKVREEKHTSTYD